MQRAAAKLCIAAGFMFLAGCNQSGERKLDIIMVMDRTIDTIIDYTKEVKLSGAKADNPAVMQGFFPRLHAALNSRPDVFTNGTLGLRVNDDASFAGFDDPNKNNVQDAGEQQLFTLEIDAENERLIATDFAENIHGTTFRDGQYDRHGFFFVWVSSRQSAAGVAPNRFAGRNVQTRMKPARIASTKGRVGGRKKNARSKARSGGARTGK